SEGMYCSRHLSFEGCVFEIIEHKLDVDERKLYDTCATLWQKIIFNMFPAIYDAGYDKRETAKRIGLLWSAQQRFFLQLCLSLKVSDCVRLVEEALENGHSVVIGLFSTGESLIEGDISDEFEDLVSAPKAATENLVKKWFPEFNAEGQIMER